MKGRQYPKASPLEVDLRELGAEAVVEKIALVEAGVVHWEQMKIGAQGYYLIQTDSGLLSPVRVPDRERT